MRCGQSTMSAKRIADIPTKHTHVQGCRFSDCGILAPQHDFTVVFMGQANAGFDNERTRYSSHPTKPAFSDNGLETECRQDVCTEDGAVSSSIQQQRCLDQ